MKINRAHIAFGHDVIMAAASFILSLFLRLGDDIVFHDEMILYLSAGVFTVVAGSVFWSMRMYRGVWRYASLNDLMLITKAATLAILVFLVIMFVTTRLEDLPRSLPFINWFVLIALLGGPRFIYRIVKDGRFELRLDPTSDSRVPVLLAGAGDGAEMFIRAMTRPDANYRVVGIVARTAGRVGRNIHDVEVMGTIGELAGVHATLKSRGPAPQRLIVTEETFDGEQLSGLLDEAGELGMVLARLPSLTDFRQGIETRIEVRPVDVEDLLGRPQTRLNRKPVEELISGKRVLITGAGGSIGSELVRQVSELGPAHLSLLDNSEYNLFTIDRRLAEAQPGLPRDASIADVRDRSAIERLFTELRPDIVFHAAALKHVPMVEANPLEGFATNAVGTANVLDASRRAGARVFVQISTDKAVNPTNVMGASKRIAETYCQATDLEAADGDPAVVTVRFGNVLGSTGSVVELFRGQLARGGPLTVTHPEMQRYFMTVHEAVELVLQAAALEPEDGARSGRIYVLDMGEPVRIVDLANQMIRLAGYAPGEQVKIEYCGVRPGEKLFEEIFHGAEPPVPTSCEGLLLASPRAVPLAQVRDELGKLAEACRSGELEAARAVVAQLVPEYAPAAAENIEAAQ